MVVREGGVEPPRPFGHTDLNRARLPIPPLARAAEETLAHGRPPTQNDGTPLALTLVVTRSWEDRNHAECGKWQIPWGAPIRSGRIRGTTVPSATDHPTRPAKPAPERSATT